MKQKNMTQSPNHTQETASSKGLSKYSPEPEARPDIVVIDGTVFNVGKWEKNKNG